LDSEALSDDDLLSAYKDQQKVERGFRFLKDPLFMGFMENWRKIQRSSA
jgi:transposase